MTFHTNIAKRANGLRAVGASTLAIAAMLMAAPAWAQDTQSDTAESPDTAAKQDGAIVVTGLRASLQDARQRKKNSEQIIDSISAQDIGALPDRSVSEALQRIAGVTLQ